MLTKNYFLRRKEKVNIGLKYFYWSVSEIADKTLQFATLVTRFLKNIPI
jgi:hypothetical protein